MRLVCPACETAYDVPDSALRAGRALRCARCRYEWVPIPDEAEPIDPTYAAPLPEITVPIARVSDHAAAQSRHAARAEVLAAWFLTLLLLAAGIAEAVYWRSSIIRAWPPSERAYAILGYRDTPP